MTTKMEGTDGCGGRGRGAGAGGQERYASLNFLCTDHQSFPQLHFNKTCKFAT